MLLVENWKGRILEDLYAGEGMTINRKFDVLFTNWLSFVHNSFIWCFCFPVNLLVVFFIWLILLQQFYAFFKFWLKLLLGNLFGLLGFCPLGYRTSWLILLFLFICCCSCVRSCIWLIYYWQRCQFLDCFPGFGPFWV